MKTYNIYLLFIFFGCNPSSNSENTDLNDFKFLEIDIVTLNRGYINQDYTIQEVVQSYIDRIKNYR